MVKLLDQWALRDQVVAMCFHMTASNTGVHYGACAIIEEELGRNLDGLVRRHHMYELGPAVAYDYFFGTSSGLDIPLFKGFKKC